MELRSVAYNPIPAPGMGGMQGMQGMESMQGMPGMQGMQGMGGMQGGMMGHGMYPQGGFVNLDVDMDPGFATLDLDSQMGCAPCGPHMMHHQVHCPMPTPIPTPTPQPEVYVVKKGDSIYKIAKRYGTTMQAIILGNNLRNPDLIYPGQILFIPGV
ncbi:hypothetical protein JCM17380_11930 [Desulfosporosinus burensis]